MTLTSLLASKEPISSSEQPCRVGQGWETVTGPGLIPLIAEQGRETGLF